MKVENKAWSPLAPWQLADNDSMSSDAASAHTQKRHFDVPPALSFPKDTLRL